jgi:serine/threonine protein kinase
VVCRNLSHANILPFLGVSATESQPLCLVSKWMPNGNISEFLKRDGQFDRRPLVRLHGDFFSEVSRVTPALSS